MEPVKLIVPPDRDKPHSSMSGEDIVYTVEARYCYDYPINVGAQIFDNRWQEIKVEESQHGVSNRIAAPVRLHGKFNYAAAQAIRWLFLADAALHQVGFCFETRLVKHKVKFSHEIFADVYIDPQDYRGDVPADMIFHEEEP